MRFRTPEPLWPLRAFFEGEGEHRGDFRQPGRPQGDIIGDDLPAANLGGGFNVNAVLHQVVLGREPGMTASASVEAAGCSKICNAPVMYSAYPRFTTRKL